MLYIFDKDNTLVSGLGNRPANTPAEQSLLPGVLEKIAQLRTQGHKVAIASNQGGVAWGFISYAQAETLLQDCADKLGGVDAFAFCPHDDHKNAPCPCRKPRPGMLLELMATLHFSPGQTVMVGDQESDLQAAKAAGCAFHWAHDFFA